MGVSDQLFGSGIVTLDEDRRCRLPSKLRRVLLDEGNRTTAVVLLHTVPPRSLRIVDVGPVHPILANSSPSTKWARFLGARAAVHARYVRCDARGRFTVATRFLEHLGIHRQARPRLVVVGCGRSIALLTIDAWSRLERARDDEFTRLMNRFPSPLDHPSE